MCKIDPTVFKNSTAVIDNGAEIGKHTKIWHWVHISGGAKIGSKCSLGQNVFVSDKTRIGNNVKIQNNVSIYDEVIIEDNVFCGPSMVFTNVKNPRSLISRKSEYKKTIVKEGASLGANSTIICGITLGKYCFIAAGAVVTKDVKNYALVSGIPAKQVGWMSEYGENIPLPINGKGEWLCKNTNKIYFLNNDELFIKDI